MGIRRVRWFVMATSILTTAAAGVLFAGPANAVAGRVVVTATSPETGSESFKGANAVCPTFVETAMTERSVANIAERTGRSRDEAGPPAVRASWTSEQATMSMSPSPSRSAACARKAPKKGATS